MENEKMPWELSVKELLEKLREGARKERNPKFAKEMYELANEIEKKLEEGEIEEKV